MYENRWILNGVTFKNIGAPFECVSRHPGMHMELANTVVLKERRSFGTITVTGRTTATISI
jgi:hypothetical protein